MSPIAKWAVLACIAVCIASNSALAAQPAAAMPATASVQPAADKLKVGATLENLMVAFNDESNTAKHYESYARKAGEEDYPEVARMFRAAAESEKIHAANLAKVIKDMGGKAEAILTAVEVKSTRENLEAAVRGETYESETLYPAFLKVARKDANKNAFRTFNFAKEVEAGHAKLYQYYLDNLNMLKGVAGEPFYVCATCGNTVRTSEMNFKNCLICFKPRESFKVVR